MRKSTSLLISERATLAGYDVTDDVSAYSGVQGRPGVKVAAKGHRFRAGLSQSRKRSLHKARGKFRELDALESAGEKGARHIAGYVLDVIGDKVVTREGRHVKTFAILRPEVGARSRDLKALTAVDLRDLAQDTLNRLSKEAGATAVDYLATVFAKLSTGEISKLKKGRGVVTRDGERGESSDPLAAARARGRRFALEQYEDPNNLPLLEARAYAGRNERSINEDRQNGEVYALLPPGKTRGFRYPKWQFDVPPERLKAALRPFVDADANCWVIHSFMMRKRDALHGKSPADIVLDDKEDVKQVIDLAEGDLAGEQGAP